MSLKRPEDILPEDQNYAVIDGVTIRKGSLAAFFQAANIYSKQESSKEEKSEAFKLLKELAPALRVLGVAQQVNFKNPEIQKIFDEQ